jgi:hypothetical protein
MDGWMHVHACCLDTLGWRFGLKIKEIKNEKERTACTWKFIANYPVASTDTTVE